MGKVLEIHAGDFSGVCTSRAELSDIRIADVTPFTTIDYPGCLSAVVFLQGCPWRCPYCHNPWMQSREPEPESVRVIWEDIVALLNKRKGLLDAVVFSGGEPCLDPALGEALRYVKSLGMKAGLHTSGAYPKRLREVISLVDWVGLDVKGPPDSPDTFDRSAGRIGASRSFKESFDIVRASGVAYEARTTAHPDLLSAEDILHVAHWLAERNCSTFALQIYRSAPGITTGLSPVGADYPGQETERVLSGLFPSFTLRRS